MSRHVRSMKVFYVMFFMWSDPGVQACEQRGAGVLCSVTPHVCTRMVSPDGSETTPEGLDVFTGTS